MLIWVLNSQISKYLCFDRLHQGGVRVTLMVVPKKMQHPMNDKVSGVMFQTTA